MNNKAFFVGLLVVVGCASWLAGCTTDEESSDGSSGWGPSEPIDDERADAKNEETAGANQGYSLKAQSFPNCGILACPHETQCAFDASGETACMAPPGSTCSTIDCGAYFHCEMTAGGTVCAAGGAEREPRAA